MSLPAIDVEFLKARGFDHNVKVEGNMTCVEIRAYRVPKGYATESSTLLLRLAPGYPDVPPDMWWFDPPVMRADGREIPATQHRESHLGRVWQRWSRHFNSGQWRPGIDCLESYLALIAKELERCAMKAAA